jgi:hypothetical protein
MEIATSFILLMLASAALLASQARMGAQLAFQHFLQIFMPERIQSQSIRFQGPKTR